MKRYRFVRELNPIAAVYDVMQTLQENLGEPVSVDKMLCKCREEHPSISPEEMLQISRHVGA